MDRVVGTISAVLIFVLTPSMILADSTTNRHKSLNMLYSAYQKYYTGNQEEGRKGVNAALKVDPELAYGNIVRGEIAMKDEDWTTAQKYLEKGLTLLKQPNQPLSPDPKTKITVEEVEGDARCFLGYVYIKQAHIANLRRNDRDEQRYLGLAHKSLNDGLKLKPGSKSRELAEGLLKMFR